MPIKLKDDLKVNCFQCKREIFVKYNYPQKRYSQKNHWGYWTEKEENKDKYICDNCFLNFYYKKKSEYLKNVTSKKRRQLVRSYVADGTFRG